jgi:hypothetical protein
MKYLNLIITMSIFLYPLNASSQSIKTFKVAVEINDQIITNYEIEQRIKMLNIFGAKSILKNEVINSLIEDRLIDIVAAELEVKASKTEIAQGLEDFAKRGNLSETDLLEYLNSKNVSHETLTSYIASGLTKRKVIQKKFVNNIIISQSDVASAIDTMNLLSNINTNIYEYIELSLKENKNKNKKIGILNSIEKMVDNCLDLQSVVKKYVDINLIIKKEKKKNIKKTTLKKLNNLDIYETKVFNNSKNKQYLLMLCSRNSEIDKIALDTIHNKIFNDRINKIGNTYIQELRGEAFISIK